MNQFKDQIKEDISIIQSEWNKIDNLLYKDEYAFNYWILSKLYDIDEELIPNYVVEYNDKGIDCFVDFEESKELFIIQNKYYDENTALKRNDVSDFLTSPISILSQGKYTKSKELQEIFTNAINDPDYKIWFHFYITNDKKNEDAEILISEFNKNQDNKAAQIRAEIFYLKDIYELYFGESFQENVKFDFTIHTVNKGTILKILPEEYNLEGMSEAYYVMTPIIELYEMNRKAIDRNYQLFEENIREYLGKSSINNGIIRTLKDKKERKNFFYFNNGVTIICENTEKNSGVGYNVTMKQPQIVNGCQTVNTIYEVLKDYKDQERKNEFSNVYVMTKVLIFNKEIESKKPDFYKEIVKYTNRQNAIKDDAFGASNSVFINLQNRFKERGFLLLVKPSDRIKFKNEFSNKSEFLKLISKSKNHSPNINVELNTLSDIQIPLDKLLQLFLAIMKDGHEAYKKKSLVLKPTSDIYKSFSVKIQDWLTVDSMIRLFLLFKRAELDRKNSEDNKTPIPYYLIGFIGYFIKDKNKKSINKSIDELFKLNQNELEKVYDYFKTLTNLYKNKHPNEYNAMVKQHIDFKLLDEQIDTLKTILDMTAINKYINTINE